MLRGGSPLSRKQERTTSTDRQRGASEACQSPARRRRMWNITGAIRTDQSSTLTATTLFGPVHRRYRYDMSFLRNRQAPNDRLSGHVQIDIYITNATVSSAS